MELRACWNEAVHDYAGGGGGLIEQEALRERVAKMKANLGRS